MHRVYNRNLFIFITLFFFLIVLSYTYDYIELIVLTIETPRDINFSSYISENSLSLISSQIKSINEVIPLLKYQTNYYLIIAFIFHIIKAVTYKEIIFLCFILVFYFIKYQSDNQNNYALISKAIKILIIVLLLSNILIFYITAIESGFEWVDKLTCKILTISILSISSVVIFMLGCVNLYQPIKKRIYTSPPY